MKQNSSKVYIFKQTIKPLKTKNRIALKISHKMYF